MKIKCIRVAGLLAQYFTPGVEYPASIGEDGIVRCHDDDKNTVAQDEIRWVFWQMPNGKVSAYQKSNDTLFEVLE